MYQKTPHAHTPDKKLNIQAVRSLQQKLVHVCFAAKITRATLAVNGYFPGVVNAPMPVKKLDVMNGQACD